MKNLSILLAAAALVVSAAAAVPASAAPALQTPPPETVWAFFEALPNADLPAGINSRDLRVQFHKDYEDQIVDPSDFEDDEEFYYGDMYMEQISWQIFWNPEILEPYWDAEEEEEGEYVPQPSLVFSIYPGSDPDRIFGLLEITEFRPRVGTIKLGEHSYWYSVSKNTVTPVALPLDVTYTDDEITDDGMLLYNQNELYWVMRDRRMEWYEEQDRITLNLDGIGSTPVSYVWNGTKFVRDRSYNPLLVYSGGLGRIGFGETVPFGIHGYDAFWFDTDEENVRAWRYVKEGEEKERFVIYSYGNGPITVDAIDVLYPNYKLFEKIHVGMPASEAMEAFKEFYGYMDEPPTPYVSAFDGKAWIFSGYDDPYMLGVDLKYYKNNKLTPDAKIAVIKIAPAVG